MTTAVSSAYAAMAIVQKDDTIALVQQANTYVGHMYMPAPRICVC